SLPLCRNLLQEVMFEGGDDSPYARVMRGHSSLSQLLAELERGCRARAGAALPDTFSVARAFEGMVAEGSVNVPLLRAAVELRANGFKTGVLTNNWVDDGAGRLFTATLLGVLRRHFDVVIESCRAGLRKPELALYSHALQALRAQPHEVIFLDDVGENLKPARAMGMATVLVRDTEAALRELQELSGVQAGAGLLGQKEPLPTACDPDSVSHGYVAIRPGVQLHFVEMGHGPVVCLCHGFPESWLSWRYQVRRRSGWATRGTPRSPRGAPSCLAQLPALADAGFRVIALEMKGYGDSAAPPGERPPRGRPRREPGDVFPGIAQAVLVGHDWGGAVVWNMALFYPERVRAVASLNTPYRPADPDVDIVERMSRVPAFDYQFYFQEPGVAEAELERDVGRTLRLLIRSASKEDRLPSSPGFHGVRERGGLLVGFPADAPASRILAGPALHYYVQQFTKSGFRGPLNWYRNMRRNWRWALLAKDRKILMPALMVTAGKDPVLRPAMAQGMEEWIPHLSRGHIEECGHWTQMERPAELNRILLEWLEKLPASPAPPKLCRL
ncbi:HYES hydrolase, partial [Nothoprocta pentlandii]|nr:HYES hydrolase [Nothoprocta pentlandii]